MSRELGIAALMELERRKCADGVEGAKYFLEHHVVTQDEADQSSPFKRMPGPGEKPYVYLLADRWLRHRLLLVPKSRRMICTWTFLALGLWDCGFHGGRHGFVGSKKEEDAGFLLDKIETMAEPLVATGLLPEYKRRREPHEIRFPSLKSRISGIASGPDQLRQYTASWVFFDEGAFHDNLKATLGASAATILGGGRLAIISSANSGSYMQKLVHGTADEVADAA